MDIYLYHFLMSYLNFGMTKKQQQDSEGAMNISLWPWYFFCCGPQSGKHGICSQWTAEHRLDLDLCTFSKVVVSWALRGYSGVGHSPTSTGEWVYLTVLCNGNGCLASDSTHFFQASLLSSWSFEWHLVFTGTVLFVWCLLLLFCSMVILLYVVFRLLSWFMDIWHIV